MEHGIKVRKEMLQSGAQRNKMLQNYVSMRPPVIYSQSKMKQKNKN